jgi:hypothetical protein
LASEDGGRVKGPSSPLNSSVPPDGRQPWFQAVGADPRIAPGVDLPPWSVVNWNGSYFYKCGALSTNWDPITCFGSGGARVLYELDFTAQPNQTFSANGNVTIDGKTWEVQNFAAASVENAIVNGVGWRTTIAAAATNDQSFGTISCPRLVIPWTDLHADASPLGVANLQAWLMFDVSGGKGSFAGVENGTEYRTPGALPNIDTHYRCLRTKLDVETSGVNTWSNLTTCNQTGTQRIQSNGNANALPYPDVTILSIAGGWSRADGWFGYSPGANAWPVVKEMTANAWIANAEDANVAGVATGYPGPQTIKLKESRCTLAMQHPNASAANSTLIIKKLRVMAV